MNTPSSPIPAIRLSHPSQEFPIEASKWLQVQALLNAEEMASLLSALPEFNIYITSCVTKIGEGGVTIADFLEAYRLYVEALQQGILAEEKSYRHFFSSVFTVSPEALFAVKVAEDQQVIRVASPVLQLQLHRMDYSKADGKFRSKTFGMDSISWGIQFSYPQLFKDPVTQDAMQVGIDFPNTKLFHAVQRWLRQYTVPTPILVGEQLINVPMRLGKECFPWINRHPDLIEKGFKIKGGL